MTDQNKNIKMKFTNRTSNFSGAGQVNHDTDYFGVEQGKINLRRFKLLLRTGKQVSIPYAFLPIIILEHEGLIHIKTNDLNITIEGRGLKALEEHLSQEKVRWIKESISGNDQNEAVFIKHILIDGDIIV